MPCKGLAAFIPNKADFNYSLSAHGGVLIGEINVLIGKKTKKHLLFHGTTDYMCIKPQLILGVKAVNILSLESHKLSD